MAVESSWASRVRSLTLSLYDQPKRACCTYCTMYADGFLLLHDADMTPMPQQQQQQQQHTDTHALAHSLTRTPTCSVPTHVRMYVSCLPMCHDARPYEQPESSPSVLASLPRSPKGQPGRRTPPSRAPTDVEMMRNRPPARHHHPLDRCKLACPPCLARWVVVGVVVVDGLTENRSLGNHRRFISPASLQRTGQAGAL